MTAAMTTDTEVQAQPYGGGDGPSGYRRARYHLRGSVVNKPAATTLTDALVKPRPWMAEGICRQVDADLWFPEDGRSCKPAKDICRNSCPVRAECLAYADEIRPRDGVWGGLSQNELRDHWRADEAA